MENADKLALYESAATLVNQRRFAEAFPIYERLALKGDVQSQVFLGWMYYEGKGVAKDKERGLSWFSRAAMLGSREGAYQCGRHAFALGQYDVAIDWFYKAAEKKYGPALLWLGLIFVRGLGREVNINKGAGYLKQAADEGNIFALRELGLLMLRGKLGPMKVLLGLILVPYAVIAGIVIAVLDNDSDKLKS